MTTQSEFCDRFVAQLIAEDGELEKGIAEALFRHFAEMSTEMWEVGEPLPSKESAIDRARLELTSQMIQLAKAIHKELDQIAADPKVRLRLTLRSAIVRD